MRPDGNAPLEALSGQHGSDHAAPSTQVDSLFRRFAVEVFVVSLRVVAGMVDDAVPMTRRRILGTLVTIGRRVPVIGCLKKSDLLAALFTRSLCGSYCLPCSSRWALAALSECSLARVA